MCARERERARWGAGAREDVVQGLLQKGLATERDSEVRARRTLTKGDADTPLQCHVPCSACLLGQLKRPFGLSFYFSGVSQVSQNTHFGNYQFRRERRHVSSQQAQRPAALPSRPSSAHFSATSLTNKKTIVTMLDTRAPQTHLSDLNRSPPPPPVVRVLVRVPAFRSCRGGDKRNKANTRNTGVECVRV